jgi:hypothetical protein
LGQPIHHSLVGVSEYPYTISFAIRKRLQYDSFSELPKEKQPPDDIWDKPEELEEWFDKVFKRNEKPLDSVIIDLDDIEE